MEAIESLDRAVTALSLFGEKAIDEVSLLFGSENHLEHFMRIATALRFKHFNSVDKDTMVRLDKQGEKFDVRFEFFKLPQEDSRIEAMVVLGGTAPLHEQSLAENGSGAPFHLSYKLDGMVSYANEVDELRRERGLTMSAEYRNSYGMMSYWTDNGSVLPYLKPRINTRDTPQ